MFKKLFWVFGSVRFGSVRFHAVLVPVRFGSVPVPVPPVRFHSVPVPGFRFGLELSWKIDLSRVLEIFPLPIQNLHKPYQEVDRHCVAPRQLINVLVAHVLFEL